jgi:large subunit ribosomal protein L6
MSRIGKKTILIPESVKVELAGSLLKVAGPKGELSLTIDPEMEVTIVENVITVKAKDELKRLYPKWGLTRALINNMVVGVTKGFEVRLDMVGVGYRAKQNGADGAILTVGYSHPIDFKAPQGVTIQIPDQAVIVITGADRRLVGQTAANIRKIRPPEPYKGKGIKYVDEVVRRKAGKAGKAVGGTGAAK